MSRSVIFRPPSDIIVDPAPRPDLAILVIARRARISIPHAAVVAQLAGLGPRGRGADEFSISYYPRAEMGGCK